MLVCLYSRGRSSWVSNHGMCSSKKACICGLKSCGLSKALRYKSISSLLRTVSYEIGVAQIAQWLRVTPSDDLYSVLSPLKRTRSDLKFTKQVTGDAVWRRQLAQWQ